MDGWTAAEQLRAKLYLMLGSSYYSNFSGGTTAARRVGECLTRMPTHTLVHTNTNIKAPQGWGEGVSCRKKVFVQPQQDRLQPRDSMDLQCVRGGLEIRNMNTAVKYWHKHLFIYFIIVLHSNNVFIYVFFILFPYLSYGVQRFTAKTCFGFLKSN